jgi:hypothetical protein
MRKRGLNMKKILLIALVAAGFALAATPRAEAGVSVGIGIGFPIGGYCGYPYAYPGYYGYGYPYYGYYGPSYVRAVHRPYYWSHGRRIYNARRYRHY